MAFCHIRIYLSAESASCHVAWISISIRHPPNYKEKEQQTSWPLSGRDSLTVGLLQITLDLPNGFRAWLLQHKEIWAYNISAQNKWLQKVHGKNIPSRTENRGVVTVSTSVKTCFFWDLHECLCALRLKWKGNPHREGLDPRPWHMMQRQGIRVWA